MISINKLPKWAFCIPFVMQWIGLSVRYGSLTLPSTVNPNIETGGLAGESKSVYLEQIGAPFQHRVAPTLKIVAGAPIDTVKISDSLGFPLIAKPDIGWCGYGVRKIRDAGELIQYATAFPKNETLLAQKFIAHPYEAGLYYVRSPGQSHGRVVSATIRHRLFVEGDGQSPVAKLIDARGLSQQGNSFAPDELRRIPGIGEIIYLTTVASLRIGGRYEDAKRLITPQLEKAVDDLCGSMSDFYWGRLDVKFVSEQQLGLGNFTVFEINGAGSEAINFWDPAIPIVAAFKGVFAKQRDLFAQGDAMRRAGHRPVGVIKLAKAWLKQQRLIAQYPSSN